MAMNNETSGKPMPMSYKANPGGGTDPNSTKPGSGLASGTTAYGLKNPDTFYRVTGGPTLGTPTGGPDEPASSKNPKRMSRSAPSTTSTPNSGRNSV